LLQIHLRIIGDKLQLNSTSDSLYCSVDAGRKIVFR
jgi:hypothetical protein